MNTYNKDILKHLRHAGCLPQAVRNVEDGIEAMRQAIGRAADEIERLRNDNKELRRRCSKLAKQIG